uniref:phosphopantetheine-binding protein n=1 Tax=Paenibacillus sp. FSL K6-1096 TaxID=2921460 RepID=UPI00403F42EA
MINTHTSNIALEYSLNSILIMEYLLRIEEVFDIEIGDDDLNGRLLNNFEDLSTYIMKKL